MMSGAQICVEDSCLSFRSYVFGNQCVLVLFELGEYFADVVIAEVL